MVGSDDGELEGEENMRGGQAMGEGGGSNYK